MFWHFIEAMADEEGKWSVREWLQSFGFDKFLSTFLDNGYETKKLCSNLKAEDLNAMDITELPHRSTLFNQSEMLKNSCSSSTNSSSKLDNGYMTVPPLPPSSPETVSSVTSSDLNSETYSTVFDDVSQPNSAPLHPIKPIIAKKHHLPSDPSKPSSKTLPTTSRSLGSPGRSFKLESCSPTSPPKTKLELKWLIRELVQRDGLRLDKAPYCNEQVS